MADKLDIFSGGKKMRVASVQHLPTERKEHNLKKLEQLINTAVKKGAILIVLPEFATTVAPNSAAGLKRRSQVAGRMPQVTSRRSQVVLKS